MVVSTPCMGGPTRERSPWIVVVGSAIVDLTTFTDDLPGPGQTIFGRRFDFGWGGKGANQAVAAAPCGATVDMVPRVGDDLFGPATIENFIAKGIGAEHVRIVSGASSILRRRGRRSKPRPAGAVCSQGVARAIITLGDRGAVLVSSEGAVHVPAFAVPVKDSTGAGDAFIGSFAVFLAEGLTDATRLHARISTRRCPRWTSVRRRRSCRANAMSNGRRARRSAVAISAAASSDRRRAASARRA